MSRRPPAGAPDLTLLPHKRHPFLEVELQLVTPIFGGGALPGEPDRDDPVRVASVRGQLRFWWRACKAAHFATPEELFQAEAAIWGRSATTGNSRVAPSAVDITVAVLDPGRLRPCAVREQERGRARLLWQLDPARQPPGALPYLLWPFVQGEAGNPKPPAPLCEGLRFRVSVTLAAHVAPERSALVEREVRAALWAWATFGGLGARTRRGCGALYSPLFHAPGDPVQALRQGVEQYVAPGTRSLQIPSLRGATVLLGEPAGPLAAWKQAAAWLQSFRQDREAGGRPDQPGRSRWPEAASVRQLLNRSGAATQAAQPLFPRAHLGLPIVFQRMGRPAPVLQAGVEGATRFASPIVLRPLAVSPNRAVPMVLAFDAPHIWELAGAVLRAQGPSVEISKDALRNAGQPGQIGALQGHATAREALLAGIGARPGVRRVTL
jgi:CRISPR-associated protein Cmr1